MTTYQRVVRARQDREALTDEATELRIEGVGWTEISQRLGVAKGTVECWVKESPRMTCACGEKLVRPVEDDRCGFCRLEAAVPA